MIIDLYDYIEQDVIKKFEFKKKIGIARKVRKSGYTQLRYQPTLANVAQTHVAKCTYK